MSRFDKNLERAILRKRLGRQVGKMVEAEIRDYLGGHTKDDDLVYVSMQRHWNEAGFSAGCRLQIWLDLLQLQNKGVVDAQMRERLIEMSYDDEGDVFLALEITTNLKNNQDVAP